MSSLPQIDEDLQNKNIKKLINQNKKLRKQIFVFEEQLNLIISNTVQEENTKNPLTGKRKSTPIAQKSTNLLTQKNSQTASKIQQNLDKINQEEINKLLQIDSPLIQTRIIPSLKQKLQYLKAQNIKQNIHYILVQEDELKILKKELYKLRKEKQVITQFVRDKSEKLQKSNNQLINHKKSLRQQLESTIKFNRQSSSQITQLERQIRKYHFALLQFKKLSDPSIILKESNQKNVSKSVENQQKQVIQQINKIQQQIINIQKIWKPKIQIFDMQYNELKQQFAKKSLQENQVKRQQTFQKTRILTMKDQQAILQQKERLKLAKVSPKLKKQLELLRKQEQQKQRKKQQYLKSHLPRDKDEQILNQILIKQAKKSPNPENTQVETQRDDKNIIKLKSYLKKKNKQDKLIETDQSLSLNHQQKDRMQRSWSNHQTENQGSKYSNFINKKVDQENVQQKVMPRLLLKNIKMGTTFQNQP